MSAKILWYFVIQLKFEIRIVSQTSYFGVIIREEFFSILFNPNANMVNTVKSMWMIDDVIHARYKNTNEHYYSAFQMENWENNCIKCVYLCVKSLKHFRSV